MNYKSVFLGDSIIERFEQLNELNSVVNLGVSGDKTIDIIARLDEVYEVNPKELFLLVGINDLLNNYSMVGFKKINVERTFESILKNITTQLPNSIVYIISVLPICEGLFLTEEMSVEINKSVDELNHRIKALCDVYNVTFININKTLKLNNQLRKDYSEDGIHLSKMGYKKFFQKILNFCNNFGVKNT